MTLTYWQRRAEENLLDDLRDAEILLGRMRTAYRDAAARMEKEISALLARYMNENGLRPEVAYMYLSDPELRIFKKDLLAYLKEIERAGINTGKGRTLYLELNTLSTRTRLERMEAVQAMVKANAGSLAAYEDQAVTEHLSKLMERDFERNLKDFYHGGSRMMREAIERQSVRLTNEDVLFVLRQPWSGKNYSERIWDAKYNVAEKVRRLVTANLTTGKHPRELAKEITGELGKEYKYVAERLVRTETAYVKGQSDILMWKKLHVQEYELLATLDNRTSEICQEMDRKIFKVSEIEVGYNYPPFHPNCRTVGLPVVPEEDKTEVHRAARDENGKNIFVDKDTKYEDWAKEMEKRRASQ